MRLPSAAPALAAALLLASCGSGNGDSAQPLTFVHGAVDATGTLTVNGTAFDTRGAVVRYLDDGRTLTAADAPSGLPFVAGTVVAVRGAIAHDRRTGVADEVMVRSVLRGPLQGRAESSIAVAGADVLLDSRTAILGEAGAPASIESLPAGARVEVHGWPESGTRVRATLVRALPGDPLVAVHGWTLAAPVSGAFDLSLVPGGAPVLRVDAASATTSPTVPANALVRVGGSGIAAGAPPVLAATSVDVLAQLLPVGEDRAVVEGVVSSGALASFTVGDHLVRTTTATIFDGVPQGSSADAVFAPGVRLVVEGARQGRELAAERVRFVDVQRHAGRIAPGSFHLLNPAAAGSFTLGGEIVVVEDFATRITATGAAITLRQLFELHSAEAAGLPIVAHGYRRADGAVRTHRIDVAAP
ncbi:MAG TPA: DUF5666 domain-containing protein [Anaeromyxobacteraceae bacterium]|nr:DUF5666 domain-containing protein [Anaeromyxobacteraceae bacterium]